MISIIRTGTTRTGTHTRLGRLIEETSYWEILKIATAVYLLSIAYFLWATPFGHGIDDKTAELGQAAYFSAVTISSLGYGDMAPLGFGRFVSAVVVVAGLFLVALLVAKLASERQAAILNLLYSSDQERRISGHTIDLDNLRDEIVDATGDRDNKELRQVIRKTIAILHGIGRYFDFHYEQGFLVDSGNSSPIRSMCASLLRLQEVLIAAYEAGETALPIRVRVAHAVAWTKRIADLMLEHENASPKTTAICTHIRDATRGFMQRKIEFESGRRKFAYQTELTEDLLENVSEYLREDPRPRDLHKRISEDLNISKTMAIRAIEMLDVRQGLDYEPEDWSSKEMGEEDE